MATTTRNARKGTGATFTPEEKLAEVSREIVMRKRMLKKKQATSAQVRQLDIMRAVAKDYQRQVGVRLTDHRTT